MLLRWYVESFGQVLKINGNVLRNLERDLDL